MQTLSPFTAHLAQSIGWALLHSLWQGAVVWALLMLMFRLLPAMTARLKYHSSLFALALFVLWTVNTCFSQWQRLQLIPVRVIDGPSALVHTELVNSGALQGGAIGSFSMKGWVAWLLLGYILGLIIMLIRMCLGLSRLSSLKRDSIALDNMQVQRRFESLLLQMDIAGKVVLRLSTRIAVPVAIGVLRPMILLPATAIEELDADALDALLIHELAHIGRSDYLVNILQAIVEAVFFFNPFAWMISALIRREREHCCDDVVVAQAGNPLNYARTLAALAGSDNRAGSMAIAADGNAKHHLFARIRRIVRSENRPVRSTQMVVVCSIVAVILATGIACFSPSIAQRSKNRYSNTAKYKSAPDTSGWYVQELVSDSNGKRYRYRNLNDLSPDERAAFHQKMKALHDSLNVLVPAIAPMVAAADSVAETIAPVADVAMIAGKHAQKAVYATMAAVNWEQINKDIDKALAQVSTLDWNAINQQVQSGVIAADNALSDPKVRAKVKRAMAAASRELARARDEYRETRQEIAEEARQEAEEARREAEDLRRELEDARSELRRERETQKRLKQDKQ